MIRKFFLGLPILVLICGCNSTEKNQTKTKDNQGLYLTYSTLDIGEIRPQGWLLDWANSAANGITGHLDDRSIVYEKGWSGQSFEARGVKEEGTNWPLEQSAYWLDGLVRLAYILEDSVLIAKAKSRLDPIVEGVLNGGPSFIHWRPGNQLEKVFDNWAHSHMGRALEGYYSATKDSRILEALVQVYSRYTYPKVIRNDFPYVNGMVNIDPIMETYVHSRDTVVLCKALELYENQELKKLVDLWNRDSLKVGHGVVFYEHLRVPAILSMLTGEREYLQASIKALQWAEQGHLLPVGLLSSEEYLAGIGATRNIETCNVSAGGHTMNWLLRITGERKFADKIERIFFNAGPVPISRDFQTMCYYQSPNRISTILPEDEPAAPGENAYTFTEIGHEVLCCVGNSNRIIPNYISNMWMKTNDNGLVATLYGPSVVNTEINGKPITIRSFTDYPFEERVQMSITTHNNGDFPIYFRIPGWCTDPVIKVNGNKIVQMENDKGFVVVQRTWESGDKIELLFPMEVKVIQGRETKYADIKYFNSKESRRIARSNKEVNNPYSSIFYGPLLFSLPIPDDGPNAINKTVPVNFALNLSPKKPMENVKIEKHEFKRPWAWQLEHAPISIRVPVKQFNWKPSELQPLPKIPVSEGTDTTVVLVPYNITKFRVSMFPVSAMTWRDKDF